ncbi:MAG: DUF2834 domain-containing protein [Hyphomonadaceae bacterium]|nr:DUF2834 domain-containing protein [Hyphomonadaceae bacterium]
MSRTSRNLCIFYAAVALVALIATWSQNLTYFLGDTASPDRMQYLYDLKASAASRSFTVDIGLYLLAGTGLMVAEARKLGVKLVWLYVIFGFIIAISVTFPLFLIARELRLAKHETTATAVRLTVSDIIGLALTTLVVLAFSIFLFT